MQRHALGLSALALLIAGVFSLGGTDSGISGVCLRAGSVLALMWVAWPQLHALPIWLVGTIAVVLLIVMRQPKLLVAVVPLALVMWLLRPRRFRK